MFSRRIKSDYNPTQKKKKNNFFLRFIVIPMTAMSLFLVSTGILTFVNANSIMRRDPKALEDFSRNILPAYSVAYFTSLDGNTSLNGWFFPARESPVTTIIIVHSEESNRLEFDSETVALYEFFVNNKCNVLSFDLRNSGSSGGSLSAFGYTEWEDVLAAISYTTLVSSADNVVLFGINSGVTASLIAANKLMEAERYTEGSLDYVKSLPFSKDIISGFILDNPLSSGDDYIKNYVIKNEFAADFITRHTIPFAIRLSSGGEPGYSLTSILSRTQVPVHIISSEFNCEFLWERASVVINERQRLFPSQTTVYISDSDGKISPFFHNRENYISSLHDFLVRFLFVRD